MNSENNNNLHTLDGSEVIPTLEFRSDDSQRDVLDISQLLPESGVNSSNLKQFVKISSSGVFVDSSGAGQFSADNQVARFAAGNPPLNAMVAVQIADTSVIHFDRSVTANDPLVDDLTLEDIDLNELNEVTGTAQQDMLVGSASADVLYGARGDDVLEGGAGNDVYIGGAGADRYVLNDPDSVEILDFKSTRFEKDVLDVSQLLPEGADANNLLSYLSITEEGVFLDVSGNGDFSEENQIARFTEDSVFSRNEILIDIGDNVRVVFNIFAQAGVQLQDGDAFQTADVLASRTQKYNPRGQDYESDSGPGADASTAFIRSKAGELFNFRFDQHQVEEAHGSDGGEILDAAQVGLSSDAKDDNVADHKLWMYGRDGGDTLQGNADGVMLDGGRGNDRIVAGGGRNMLIGGEGRDEFVLNLETTTGDDLRSDLLYDFTSIEGNRDLLDLQHILPAEANAGNIHAYVKVTDAGMYVDIDGGGQFDRSNELARWGESVDMDNLITLRLADGSEVELDRDQAISEFTGDDGAADTMSGGQGSDILRGMGGDDVLDGDATSHGQSADHLYGGEGNDKLIVDSMDLSEGTVDGGIGFDTVKLQGRTGESLALDMKTSGVERAFGSYSDDVLDGAGFTESSGYNKATGEYEADRAQRLELFGKYGDDTLKGGAGNDYLDGGHGDDIISDGSGRDFMAGGLGSDTFVLSDDGELDTLWDFKSTSEQRDIIDISAFLPANFDSADLGNYFHADSDYVYFDPTGQGQFTEGRSIAKFGGGSVIDGAISVGLGDDITVTLKDGIVLSRPSGADNRLILDEDSRHTFTADNFGFHDSGGDSLQSVTITQLPASGLLTLNGVAVTVNQVIITADIPNLVFAPEADGYGVDYASLQFTVSDGELDSAVQNLSFDVTPVNDNPVAEIPFSSTPDVRINFEASEVKSMSELTDAGWNIYENSFVGETDIKTTTLAEVDTRSHGGNMQYISVDGNDASAEAFLIQDFQGSSSLNLPTMYYNFTNEDMLAFKESGFKISMTVMASGTTNISLGEPLTASSNNRFSFEDGIPDDNQFHDIVIQAHFNQDDTLEIDSYTVDGGSVNYIIANDGRNPTFDDFTLSFGAYSSSSTSVDNVLLVQSVKMEVLPSDFYIFDNDAVDLSLPAGAFSDIEDDQLTYSLKPGSPDWLTIDSYTGRITGTPGRSNVGEYTVTLVATDSGNASAESSFVLNVRDSSNNAVVIGGNLTLGDNYEGTTVTGMLADSRTGSLDGNPVSAIAITSVDNSNGTWEYSLNGGLTWLDVDDGSLGNNHALQLDGAEKIRFTPDVDYNGDASLTFRSWDESVGISGDYADTSVNGVETAFSSDTANAEFMVVNTVEGTEDDETLVGTAGFDAIVGGAGDDILTGGEGGDIFIFRTGDDDTASNWAMDTITDFNINEGDVLALGDVLVDEESNDLTQYLSFDQTDPDNPILEVRETAGGNITQKIALQGVDLSSLGSTDTEIINNMLNNGNLNTDV